MLTRRQLMLGAGALPLLAAPKPAPRPNIVLLTADGIGAWMLGSYGNRDIHTPNFDLLAQTGTRFSLCFACTPEAAPSRATLLSGRSPHQFGLSDSAPSLGDAKLISDALAGAGYTCGYSGVWDLGAKPNSFSHWRTDTAPEAVTAGAIEFLDAQQPGKPFFLVAAYTLPSAPADPFTKLYADSRFENLGWDPAAPNAARGKEALADILPSLRKAAASVSAVDAQVPAILARLDGRGLRDNTLIAFTSTCGSLMGRHGLWDSGRGSEPPNFYDEVTGVPMIWSWVKVPPQAVRPEVISLYDVLPAFSEAAGIPGAGPLPVHGMPGRSFLRAARNEPYPKKQRWVSLVFGEFAGAFMARDKRYKLVQREGGKGELYDVVNDPRERVNQFNNPQFVTIRDEMAGELANWRKTF